jgi:hypothetical protein
MAQSSLGPPMFRTLLDPRIAISCMTGSSSFFVPRLASRRSWGLPLRVLIDKTSSSLLSPLSLLLLAAGRSGG